jgi:pimeloyl-ACP methyl ester carboxylesterase
MSNYGGPGELGVAELLATAATGVQLIGTNYDFVSFDPRGIGYSIPLANCSASVASSPTPLTRRFVNQLHGPRFSTRFFSSFYQSQKTLGQQCQATIGGGNAAGPHMHSTVVVRDIISFLDAYANSNSSAGAPNPTLLNYWGFSYGTYIGQIFANMFPTRVGRVILDGVIDAAANLAGRELNPAYADEGFSTFFVYCNLAGAALCPFYTGTTSNDILARFEAIVTRLNPTVANLKGWSK